MKRGLTILTAPLFATALALPAMAQTSDTGANKEAPAASTMTNPATTGSDSATKPSSDDNAAKAQSGEMQQEKKPAADSSQPKADDNSTSDAGSNPAGATSGHSVE